MLCEQSDDAEGSSTLYHRLTDIAQNPLNELYLFPRSKYRPLRRDVTSNEGGSNICNMDSRRQRARVYGPYTRPRNAF